MKLEGAPQRGQPTSRSPRRWRTARPLLFTLVAVIWILGSWRFLYGPVKIKRFPLHQVGDMVFCPAGELQVAGSLRKIQVKAFFVDRFEVTRSEYALFLAANPGHQKPPHWEEMDPAGEPGSGERPVAWVDWYDAVAFAHYAGKRLPTLAEWEWAARGRNGALYPWGNMAQSLVANTAELQLGETTPVGLFEDGRSPCGAYDMVGNVWEWTASLGGIEVADRYFIRGGSFQDLLFVGQRQPDVMATQFYDEVSGTWQAREASLRGPRFASGTLGFRCVLDADPRVIWRNIQHLGDRDPVGYLLHVAPATKALRKIGQPCLPFLSHALHDLQPGIVRERIKSLLKEIRSAGETGGDGG